ncbi:MAG: hypothetical protein HFJ32_04865, partial [Clostridia bacterium]|nr:hypothetical protein [Clostridia bacterium]
KEKDVFDNEDGTYDVTTKPGYIFQIELMPTKEKPTDAEIEYIGQVGELPPEIIKLRLTEDDDRTGAQVSIKVKRGEGATYKYYWKEVGGEYGIAFYTGTELTQTITGLSLNEKSYIVKVEASNEYGMTYKEEKMGVILSDGLLQKIAKLEDSGVHSISVTGKDTNGKPEKVTYSLNVMIYKGDLTLDGEIPVDGATLSNKVYSFGSVEDVSNGIGRDAQNTVVLKVEGDLTINSGVKLTSIANAQGYGGPKGMIVYCTGKLTNNGTISMTARGARAEGQNVYLYKNANNSFEYVPSSGAAGAVAKAINGKSNTAGHPGEDGTSGSGRQTGGGGSGSALSYKWEAWTGAGGNGTSYSGGPGGGGSSNGLNFTDIVKGGVGTSDGKNGGEGKTNENRRHSAGGAGNPAGSNSNTAFDYATFKDYCGTGGLLIIYANDFCNKSVIESNGTKGRIYNRCWRCRSWIWRWKYQYILLYEYV